MFCNLLNVIFEGEEGETWGKEGDNFRTTSKPPFAYALRAPGRMQKGHVASEWIIHAFCEFSAGANTEIIDFSHVAYIVSSLAGSAETTR